jgi:hypothetical protein
MARRNRTPSSTLQATVQRAGQLISNGALDDAGVEVCDERRFPPFDASGWWCA